MNLIGRYPIIGAIIAQAIAAAIAVAMKLMLAGTLGAQSLMWSAMGVQALVAAVITRALSLPVWWVWIAVLFPVALNLALLPGDLPAWPFGVAFVVLYLFFSNTARERVPLYLTNRTTAEALLSIMKQRDGRKVIDLGSGLGGVVRALDGDGRMATGVETAPMVWLLSAILSSMTGRGKIMRQDIWSADISEQDVVYAFLSPEPMATLYDKAKREMKTGSLLVSNSFTVPDVDPDEVWELPDRRKTRLFLYEMKASA